MTELSIFETVETIIDEKLEPITAKIEDKFTCVNERFDKLEHRATKIEIEIENVISQKLDLVIEILQGINERLDRYDKTEIKVEDHEKRIWALEQAVMN